MPTNEIAATRVLTGVAASVGGSRNAAPSFTAATPPQQFRSGPLASAVARDNYSIRTVPTKSLSVASMAEWPSDIRSYRHKSVEHKRLPRVAELEFERFTSASSPNIARRDRAGRAWPGGVQKKVTPSLDSATPHNHRQRGGHADSSKGAAPESLGRVEWSRADVRRYVSKVAPIGCVDQASSADR